MSRRPPRFTRVTEASGRHRRLPYLPRKVLLSPAELRFFHALVLGIGDRHHVMAKVRLADVITCEEWESPAGRRISQKHVDFVLVVPRTSRIAAVIELDDRSHDRPDRRLRDAFLGDALLVAGVPLLRHPVCRRYDPERLGRSVRALLRRPPSNLG